MMASISRLAGVLFVAGASWVAAGWVAGPLESGMAWAQSTQPLAPGVLFVEQTFKCPDKTTVRLTWQENVQAFLITPSGQNLLHLAPFNKSEVNESNNTVACVYVLQNTIPVHYAYKAPRKIVSCTGQPAPVIKCKLKKD